MNEAEFGNAIKKSYFDFGDAVAPEPVDDEEADDLDLSVPELQALAAKEGVKLPETGTGANGRVVKADIQAAIRAARAGDAPKPADGSLDAMSDTELADTVAVLTGTRPADGTDRETLLQLARGDA
jgi:pyruvate/2-oxoglutarate dehydrogenase complex dihydrolipoamide acyltransferase (E2) component